MAISKKATEITDLIYKAYGSGTGVLFGLPPAFYASVQAIVQAVLSFNEDYEEKEV